MNISTTNNESKLTYEHYIKQTMQKIEITLNMNVANKPNLINNLDQNFNHPMFRKYSNIPFKDQTI